MDTLTSTAASGLRSRMESLDMLANNLANAATSGYKADREFYGVYTAAEVADNESMDPSRMPNIERPWVDFAQGTLQDTGSQTDLALSGRGLFAVSGPSGPLYTRNGNFTSAADGRLVTSEGYPLRTTKGKPLKIAPELPISVSVDGTVRQGGEVIGQLEIADFTSTSGLVKTGNSYFRNPDPAKPPGAAANVQIHQGKLEGSNVGPAESAVRLVAVMRQFEMLQKAVQLGTEMDKRAVEEVARVGG